MIARHHLEGQFTRAVRLGWINELHSVTQKSGEDPALILAIGSRETNLDPRYLQVPGDHGNGFGLTQLDKRYFPEWVATGKWKIARECFEKTDFLLDDGPNGRKHFEALSAKPGVRRRISTRAGAIHYYLTKAIPDRETLERIVIAAYNCGDWAYYHFCHGSDVDRGTTAGPSGLPDYSRDVLARRKVFRELWDTHFREKGDVLELASDQWDVISNRTSEDRLDEQFTQNAGQLLDQDIPAVPAPLPASETANWSVQEVKTKVETAKGAVEEVSSTLETVTTFIGKRSDQIKAFRIAMGMKGLGVLAVLEGFYEKNQLFIWFGLGLITLFALVWFLRQWHLGAIREKK